MMKTGQKAPVVVFFSGVQCRKVGVDNRQDTGREEQFFQIQTCLFDSEVKGFYCGGKAGLG